MKGSDGEESHDGVFEMIAIKKKKEKNVGTLRKIAQAVDDLAGDKIRLLLAKANESLVQLGVLASNELDYNTDDLTPALNDLILFDECLPGCPRVTAHKYKVLEHIGQGSEGVEVRLLYLCYC